MTKDQIISTLKKCEPYTIACSETSCSYYKDNNCLNSLHKDALNLIETQKNK